MAVTWARADGDHVSYSTLDAELDALTALTVACWIKPNGIVSNDYNANIITRHDFGAGNTSFIFHRSSASNTLRVSVVASDGSDALEHSFDVADGIWQLVAFTWTTNLIEIYKGSIADAGFTRSSTAITRTALVTKGTGLDVYIGNQQDTANSWVGGICHPAIWNAVITQDELLAFRFGTSPSYIRSGNLLFHSRLLSTTDVNDLSGSSHTGTTSQVTTTVNDYPPMRPLPYDGELWVPPAAAAVAPGPTLVSPVRSFRHRLVR